MSEMLIHLPSSDDSRSGHLVVHKGLKGASTKWDSTPRLPELAGVHGLLSLFGGLVHRDFIPVILGYSRKQDVL